MDTHLIFKSLLYYIATPSVSQSWCLGKKISFSSSVCLPSLVLNFVFHIDATIHLSGGFLSGITVWKADPRAGGWTPDRGQPAGAMQAWLGDGKHEQHQVRALCSPRLLSFELCLLPFKPRQGIGTLSQMWERKREWHELRSTMFKRCPE